MLRGEIVNRLSGLCSELSRIQIDLLQRRGAPLLLAHEGVQLLREQLPLLVSPIPTELAESSFVPKLMRSCATVLRWVPDEDVLPALEALDLCAHLTAEYKEFLDTKHSSGINEMCSLMRSIDSLGEIHRQLQQQAEDPSSSAGASLSMSQTKVAASVPSTRGPPSPFDPLLSPVYEKAIEMWSLQKGQATTASVLSLVEANSRVYGSGFHFPPISTDQNGLLPCKAKIHMEAKMQRCVGARGLLMSLRTMMMNRMDAGMSLAIMARTGLYDAEVCNRSCDVLYSQHALLSSQQLCQVLFHLGTLQHRHIHQKFFSSLIRAERCNAEAVRQHITGLAMLRQPPLSEERLMRGVFMHALRASHALQKHRDSTHPSSKRRADKAAADRQTSTLSPHSRRAICDPLNDVTYELNPRWYIDVGHSLTCLGIHNPKYKLMTARQTRRSIGQLTVAERCKLLYAIGGLSRDQVPVELQASWSSKVDRPMSITAEKLKNIEPHEGPYVMNALLYSGFREHPRIPRPPQLESGENPVEVLLSTWATAPKERILELTAQIKPQHLSTSAYRAPSTLATVVTHVAATCGEASRAEYHRLEPLCAAVNTHSADMTADDAIRTLQALQHIGRTGPRQRDAMCHLLAKLWAMRFDLDEEQLARCCDTVQQCTDLPDSVRLLEFAASS